MTLRIDKFGRVIIPRLMRERLGLVPNTEFEEEEQPHGVLLTVKTEQPSMVEINGRLVHQGTPEPGADWSGVIDLVREERTQATPELAAKVVAPA